MDRTPKAKPAKQPTDQEKRPTIQLWQVVANGPSTASFGGWGPVVGRGFPLIKHLN